MPAWYATPAPRSYFQHRLAVSFPGDAPERRWTRREGPIALLGQIVAHLLHEEWWRQTGEWPGCEATHGLARMAATH
jgi:hypothetical protein